MNNGIDRDLNHLHPVFRARITDVLADCREDSLGFELFEGFRSPKRQDWLYSQGRGITPVGNVVTNARPWESYHQYGLAADLVLRINGQWSWDASAEFIGRWRRMQVIARKYGLEPISWELPHVQLADIKLADLQAGMLLDISDDMFHSVLEDAAISWPTGAPPLVAIRPPLEVPA